MERNIICESCLALGYIYDLLREGTCCIARPTKNTLFVLKYPSDISNL